MLLIIFEIFEIHVFTFCSFKRANLGEMLTLLQCRELKKKKKSSFVSLTSVRIKKDAVKPQMLDISAWIQQTRW